MDRTTIVSYDNISNRFLFVLIAAKRALQLQKGAKPRIEIGTKKPTVVAMAEVMENKVEYQLPGITARQQKRLSK
jgi:DNA-directed RNA polymerase omega subunit